MRNLFISLVALTFMGCGNGGNEAPDMAMQAPKPHNYDQIRAALFPPGDAPSSCAFATSCHNEINPKPVRMVPTDGGIKTIPAAVGNLKLRDDPYAQLFNVPAENLKAQSEGKLRVKPCDPDNSFLLIKLKISPVMQAGMLACPTQDQAPAGTYGGCMPQTSAPVDSTIIEGIHDWIARGAHRTEPADVTGTTCVMETPDLSTHD